MQRPSPHRVRVDGRLYLDDPFVFVQGARVMSDKVFGSVVLAFAALMAWGAGQIQESFIQDPLGPKAFPWLIAGVMAASGAYMVVKPDAHLGWPGRAKLWELLATVGVMFAYAELLPALGFVLCTAVAASFLSWRLGSTAKQAVSAGAIMSVGIYAVFHFVLGLTLARGPWGF
jgi:putative tricarboxylic transport membrane protein